MSVRIKLLKNSFSNPLNKCDLMHKNILVNSTLLQSIVLVAIGFGMSLFGTFYIIYDSYDKKLEPPYREVRGFTVPRMNSPGDTGTTEKLLKSYALVSL